MLPPLIKGVAIFPPFEKGGRGDFEITSIMLDPNQVKPRSGVVRCQFWVERWRAAELCLTHGEVIDIGFFGHSVFCLSEGSVDPAIGAPWNMESIPLGSTEFCILPIEQCSIMCY
jgi:hypothetical protein